MSNKEPYQPDTIDDVEAEDELFGEVIEQSDAHIEDVNVMSRSDLSEASSPSRGSSIHLPDRKSKHAGVEDVDRPVAQTSGPNMSGIGITIALAVVVIGGLYLATMGGDDPAPTKDTPAVANTENTDEDDDDDTVPQIPAESDDNPNSDGTPTLDSDTLIKGMVAAGWRVGAPEVSTIPEVKQTNLLAQKDTMAATVTIYEAKTWEWAQKTVLETEAPSKAVSFGRTIARVSLGPADQQNGVVELTNALTEFKKAARAKATAGNTP